MKMEKAIQLIKEKIEAKSELYTNDLDLIKDIFTICEVTLFPMRYKE